MARVALSISADTSRFMARNRANRSAKSALLLSNRTGMMAFRRRVWMKACPLLNGAATNRRQPLSLRIKLMMAGRAFGSGVQSGGFGAFAEVGSPKIVRAKVGQLAFETFDVQPERAPLAEHQYRAAAGRIAGVKLDPEQFQPGFRRLQIDVARLARQHTVKAQRRDQAARGGLSRQRLLPIQPVHADHQPLFALPPEDIAGLHAGILHMRGNDGKIIGIERD